MEAAFELPEAYAVYAPWSTNAHRVDDSCKHSTAALVPTRT